jgi:hypothetical protein
LDGDQWNAYFDSFTADAFRFEAQPGYAMPRESDSLQRFLRGEPKPPDHNAAWHQRVRSFRAAGKTIGRVRVVHGALTDYQRYQFAWGIPGNIAAGEDIRILDLSRHDLALPVHDWWMFDGGSVVRLNFRPDGTQINRELVEGDIDSYLQWRTTALHAAIPFAEYEGGPQNFST